MKQRRVVITGLGLVTSLGESVDEVWGKICAGLSGIKSISRFKVDDFPVRFGGECSTFDVSNYGLDVKEARRLDRFGQFGLAAAVSAVKDSGLDFKSENVYRCGVLIGSGIGGIETLEEQNFILTTRNVTRVSPFTVPRLMANAASGNVITQDISTLRNVDQSSVLALAPTPAMEPTATWVVETGSPSLLAKSTRDAVIMFAANPEA